MEKNLGRMIFCYHRLMKVTTKYKVHKIQPTSQTCILKLKTLAEFIGILARQRKMEFVGFGSSAAFRINQNCFSRHCYRSCVEVLP